MKDFLQDIIGHTVPLGVIDLLKVVGGPTETVVSAVATDRSVIVSGKFVNPHPEFSGVWGMPNLSKLKTILGFTDEYDERASITVTRMNRDGIDVPVAIRFANGSGDFVNDYRLMSQAIVEEQVKTVVFKGATWNVNFEPTIAGITRLKKQAQVHSEESLFATSVKTNSDGGLYSLSMSWGDPATHNGSFVFDNGLTSGMTKTLYWPVKQFIAIMDLLGDKTVSISDQGVMRIAVSTGLVVYEYLMPAQSR